MSMVISIQYNGVAGIAQQFDESAARVKKMMGDIQQQMDTLKKGSWLSEAATRWYQEMENDVMPGVARLQEALTRSAQASRQINQVMRQAEQEAANCVPTFA